VSAGGRTTRARNETLDGGSGSATVASANVREFDGRLRPDPGGLVLDVVDDDDAGIRFRDAIPVERPRILSLSRATRTIV